MIPVVTEEWLKPTLVFLSVEIIWDWHLVLDCRWAEPSAQMGSLGSGASGAFLDFWGSCFSWLWLSAQKRLGSLRQLCPRYHNFFHWNHSNLETLLVCHEILKKKQNPRGNALQTCASLIVGRKGTLSSKWGLLGSVDSTPVSQWHMMCCLGPTTSPWLTDDNLAWLLPLSALLLWGDVFWKHLEF